jgi:hypothetical protein
VPGGLRLSGTPNVHRCKADLQDNQGVGVGVNPPSNPKYVAGDEQPESGVTSSLLTRCDEPCGEDRDDHRGPLQQIDEVG